MSANNRLQQTQEAAEEVKVIMLENMQKTEERSCKLEELDERAEALEKRSKTFFGKTEKIKKQSKMENLRARWKLIAAVVGLALIIIIVVIIMEVSKSTSEVPHEKVSSSITPGPGGN